MRVSKQQLIVFSSPTPKVNEYDLFQAFIDQGVKAIHLYRPQASEHELYHLLDSLDASVLPHIVLHHHKQLKNDFPVKGVHRQRNNDSSVPFVSCSLHQFIFPDYAAQAEYVFFSPVLPSISKSGHLPSYTFSEISQWVSSIPCPCYALGGINLDAIAQENFVQFAGVAMLGAIWQSDCPLSTVIKTMKLLT